MHSFAETSSTGQQINAGKEEVKRAFSGDEALNGKLVKSGISADGAERKREREREKSNWVE